MADTFDRLRTAGVGRFSDSQLAEPRVYSWNNAADYRRRVQMNADNTR